MMKVPSSPERRERPSRAAAPTKNMRESDSEDDGQPIRPRGPSSANFIRSDNLNSSSSSSPASITVISAPSSTLSMATLNRPSSPKKRRSTENESGSPTKKSRKIVIKTKKSTQAVTPVPSQAEITPQPASTSISEIEVVEESLKALKSRMIQDAADRAKDKKKIESIEQALQEAKTGEKGEKNFTQLTDNGQGLRKEIHELHKNNDELHKENHELKKHMSELRHRIATLMQGSIAPTSFKVMDGDVEREWKGIAFDIRNFVSQVLTKRPYRESAPRGANQNDVQALKKHLSKDANTAPYHFQRYIWLHLVEDVFQAGKATWGGPAGNAFHRYCLNISEIEFEGMEQISQFKAGQAALFSKSLNDHNREQTKDIVREMARTLEIFMDPKEKEKENGRGPMLRLRDIVCRAVELNGKFLRSRAFFLTNWIVDDFEWDDLDIHHYSGNPEGDQEVDIEISPRLRKIGNADGRCFDQATEICKPMVTVVLR